MAKLYTDKTAITAADMLNDTWLNQYNNLRPHASKYCYGKTPTQTFKDTKHIANEKNISNMLIGLDNRNYLVEAV